MLAASGAPPALGASTTKVEVVDGWEAQEKACLDLRGPALHAQPGADVVAVICRAVGAAWRYRYRKLDPGSNALVVDFGREPAQSAVQPEIRGSDLARLIAAPGLLPPEMIGGLVLRGVQVSGALTLRDADLSIPLRLEKVKFGSERNSAHDNALHNELPKDAPVSLHLVNVRSAHPLSIVSSKFDGLVAIDGSAFTSGLELNDNIFDVINADHGAFLSQRAKGDPNFSFVSLRETQIEPDLTLRGNDFGGPQSLFIRYSAVERRLLLADNQFEGKVTVLRVQSDTIDDLSNFHEAGVYFNYNQAHNLRIIAGAFGADVDVAYNDVLNTLTFMPAVIDPPSTVARVRLSENSVKANFFFKPASLSSVVKRVDLSFNDVGGRMVVEIPQYQVADFYPYASSWTGMLDLTGTQVRTRLEINDEESHPDFGVRFAARQPNISLECDDRRSPGRTLRLNLANSDVGLLAWNLEDPCSYTWRGEGLEFRHWGDPRPGMAAVGHEGEPPSEEALLAQLERWRKQMQPPNPDALAFLSDYLRSRGKFKQSRNLLEEAKRLNYVPDFENCKWKPDQPIVVPLHAVPLFPSYDAVFAPYRIWNVDCLMQATAFAFLLPIGFGVKPEWALVWIALTFGFGWATYFCYHLNRKAEIVAITSSWAASAASLPAAVADAVRRLPEWWGMRGHHFPTGPATAPQVAYEDEARFEGSGRRMEGMAEPVNPTHESRVEGFKQYDNQRQPQDFKIWVFSLDATLPVVNLHTYDAFFPERYWLRLFSYIQHVIGWWMLTLLFASITIL